MPVFGSVPAGSRAITAVAFLEPLTSVAEDLGLGELLPPSTAAAVRTTAEVRSLIGDLRQIAACPELLETPSGPIRLLEAVARAAASHDARAPRGEGRGFDSRGIVAACLEHVQATGSHQPTISELCRVAHASETRLRQAFVEQLGLPPIQYFQIRVLSMLRSELLAADPCGSTVTETATSLGLTQFGRVAGRYRVLFGETPRETLRRHQPRRF
jgi:AraC-like DNA-binding protein